MEEEKQCRNRKQQTFYQNKESSVQCNYLEKGRHIERLKDGKQKKQTMKRNTRLSLWVFVSIIIIAFSDCVKTKRQLTMLLLSTQRWVSLRGALLVWDFVPSLMNCCNIEKDYSPAAPHQWISRGKTWKMKFAFLLISWTFVEADRKWHVELPETRSFMWSSMSLGMRGYFWYTVSEYTPITCNTEQSRKCMHVFALICICSCVCITGVYEE